MIQPADVCADPGLVPPKQTRWHRRPEPAVVRRSRRCNARRLFLFGERSLLFRRTKRPINFAPRHRAVGGLIRNATASDELTLNSDKVVQNVHVGGLPFKQAGAQHSQSPIIAEAGAVIVATVDPVGRGKRFNSERTTASNNRLERVASIQPLSRVQFKFRSFPISPR
jgi:hypothetical protein